MTQENNISIILDNCKTLLNFGDYEDKIMKPFNKFSPSLKRNLRLFTSAFNYWCNLPDEKLDTIREFVYGLMVPVEIIDDIVDGSEKSFSQASAHKVYGMPAALTCAQIKTFQTLEKIGEFDTKYCLKMLKMSVDVQKVIYQGLALEIHFLEHSICPSITEYTKMINMYTSAPVLYIFNMMQMFSDNKNDYSEILSLFGIFFQIHNDCHNLFAPESEDSYNHFADDLTEGKYSYPLIYAIKDLENEDVAEILKQRPSDYETKKKCVNILKEIGCLKHCMDVLKDLVDVMKAKLAEGKENPIFEMILDDAFNFDVYWS